MVSEFTTTVLICAVALLVGGLVSLFLVIYWYQGLDESTRAKIALREDAWSEAWRSLESLWLRKRYLQALTRGLWEVWRAYAAYKRTSLVGRVDLALIYGLTALVTTAVGWNLWQVLWPLIRPRLFNLFAGS